MGWWGGEATTMLFVPSTKIQAMKWVGTSIPITMGALRSVRIIVSICNMLPVRVVVFTEDGGLEMPPQCHLYDQMAFKQWNGLELLPLQPCAHLEVSQQL